MDKTPYSTLAHRAIGLAALIALGVAPISARADIAAPDSPLLPAPVSVLQSRDAVRADQGLLDHLRSAQALLDIGDVAHARSELQDSAEFAQSVEVMFPFLNVDHHIVQARHALTKRGLGAFEQALPPVYADLDDLAQYAPHAAARARLALHHAVTEATNAQTRLAAAALGGVAQALDSSRNELPMLFVTAQIATARGALEKPRPDTIAAQRALHAALGDLITMTADTGLHTDG